MKISTRTLVAVVAVLLLGLAFAADYKLWPVLYPTVIETAQGETGCDLHQGPCSLAFADGATVTLTVAPRPVPLMQPLTLDVELRGIDPWSVAVDIQGINMNMGYNRPELKRVAGGRYTGSTLLPVCVRDRMDWRVQVMVRTAQGIRAAPYQLVTWNRR